MTTQANAVHQLFAQQVEKTPDRVAVSFGAQSATYRDVQERSNQLAHYLLANGIGRSEPVAILLDRSIEMVVTLLGVLKAGAAFVPLDPKYPADRLAMIVEEVAPRWVITQAGCREQVQFLLSSSAQSEVFVLFTDDVPSEGLDQTVASFAELATYSTENLDLVHEPDDLIYMYYTSGSTGRPKGVMGCHKSLAHFIKWEIEEFGISEGDRVSQFAALSFDASLRDLFVPLCAGGTVCLPPAAVLQDRAQLAQWVEAERLTLVHCVPSVFRQLLAELQSLDPALRAEKFPHLRYILMAGEVLEVKHVRQWMEIFGTRIQLVNLYGSTETTMIKMFHRIDKLPPLDKPIPVGKGMKGAVALILNEKQKLCGIGQVGEIYIRSPFLSLGYYQRPELTAEVFLQNPLQPNTPDRVYRTGDLGRYLPNGLVEYIGRRDNQVKVRGIRVELGEIEAALTAMEGIREVVVAARTEQEGDCTLICYFTGDASLTVEQLRAYLQTKLPDVMIPAQFHALPELPLLPNGKVDRKSLQAMAVDAVPQLGSAYVEPATETETLLASIWREVLKVERIGVHDGFFALGGHSLMAMQVLARIKESTGANVTLKDLFERLTIAELAAHLDRLPRGASFAAIEKLPVQDTYPLSHAQSRLWFLQQLNPENVTYNMPYCISLQGDLDVEALRTALQQLTVRHESLRTIFLEENGVPCQAVQDHVEIPFAYYEEAADLEWRQMMELDAKTPFTLSVGPLMRTMLFRVGEGDFRLYLNTHHIISDGWSTGLFVRELAEFYHALRHQVQADLAPLDLRYVEFAAWQNEQIASGNLQHEEAYWLETLAKPLPTLNLPLDFDRPAVMTDAGALVTYTLDARLAERAKRFAQAQETSLFSVLFTVYHLLLHRLSGDEEIIVGTPIAGRTRSELESMLGVFINTLAIRVKFAEEDTFQTLLARVQNVCLEAFQHQEYPIDMLIEKIQPDRDPSRHPVFSTVFAMQNQPFDIRMPGLTVAETEVLRRSSQFDVALKVLENEDSLTLNYEYNPDLLSEASMLRLAGQFERLLESVLEEVEGSIYRANFLTQADLQAYAEMNDTFRDYDIDHLMWEAFAKQAEERPDLIALRYRGQSMTYGELHERSNRLAHWLREQGVGRNDFVVILMERSLELMVCLYGILKAGGAYVPVDPIYPLQRVKFMIEDSAANIVLGKQEYRELLREAAQDKTILLLDEHLEAPEADIGANVSVWRDLEATPVTTPDIINEATDRAYMIYTSGSTGNPKGCVLSHRALENRMLWSQELYELGPGDVFAQRSSAAFDFSVCELFWPLRTGAALAILHNDVVADPSKLHAALKEEQVTAINFVPSLFGVLVDYMYSLDEATRPLPSLRWVFMGGEVLPLKPVNLFYEMFPEKHVLVNIYGPTETSINVTSGVLEGPQSVIVIGKVHANTQLYVMDKRGQLCPINVAGELYIGGVQLAEGYHNNPEKTAETFIPNYLPNTPGERLYRSGDRARIRPDGTIECLGRIDSQVKVRGYRIELGEIEDVLNRCPGVKLAAVLAPKDPDGNHFLVGIYSTIDPSVELEPQQVKDYLRGHMPEFMVPSRLLRLDEMPLSSNGKVDRKNLMPLATDQGLVKSVEYVAPTTPTQQAIAKLWGEALHREEIGIHDDIFEMGGHSLMIMQIFSRIRKQFQVELELKDLFSYPVLGDLAAHLDSLTSGERGTDLQIKPAPAQEHYALSHAQKRLWFLYKFDPANTAYHVNLHVLLRGDLQVDLFAKALQTLVDRHSALRTVFREVDGLPRQVIQTSAAFPFQFEDWSAWNEEEKTTALRARLRDSESQPFDLSTGPLLRAMLYRVQAGEYHFLLQMHHIITDAVSRDLLMKELHDVYTALAAGAEPEWTPNVLQYIDYAEWQASQVGAGIWEREQSYWLNELAKPLPVLELPTDFPRPELQTYNGGLVAEMLPAELVENVRRATKQEGLSMFMFLFAAYAQLLHHLTGQEDLVVGIPIAGRLTQELEAVQGFFVNTLGVRLSMEGLQTPSELLHAAREKLVAAYQHQSLPFDLLIEQLNPERDMSRSPIFSTMFQYEVGMANLMRGEHFEIEMVEDAFEVLTSKFDMQLTLIDLEDRGVHLYFQYNSDLFTQETIQNFTNLYLQVLAAFSADRTRSLASLELLTEADQRVYAELNATAADYDLNHMLVEAFVEQATLHPERIALSDGARTMTYGELQERSNALAHFLRAQGVQRNQLVAIMMERSMELMVGLYGILKSGAAYVPIDPEYPSQRIQYMIEDSGAQILLTKQRYREQAPAVQTVVLLEELSEQPSDALTWRDVAEHPTTMPELRNVPTDLAYMIYTSGSTGQPKGVLIQHRAILNRLHWHQDTFQLTPDDVVIQRTTVCFDDSVIELFWPLRHGATLSIMAQEVVLDPKRLIDHLQREQATYMQFVPSLLAVVVTALQEMQPAERPKLRTIIVSGEALPSKLVEQWFALYPDTQLANLYGPTEAAVDVSGAIYTAPASRITIGKPTANTQLYVLNARGQLCPQNVKGELYVGGVQLAAGYHNKPEKTAESFVPNHLPGAPGERLYRTGDAVRLLPDGNIEYLGRIDNQVKVRGFRIELGEIEEVLIQHAAVEMAAVIARRGPDGNMSLFGYYTSTRDVLEASELKEHLRNQLPDYMVPPRLVHLEVMPLTPNGKVDRKALEVMAERDAYVAVAEYIAPVTETETVLAAIWSDLLKQERVGVSDNFFDLGGHSLLAVQIFNRIQTVFHVAIELKDLFAYPTIRQLSAYLDDRMAAGAGQEQVVIAKAPEQEHYALSNAQKRLWFTYKLNPSSRAYNVPLEIAVKRSLDVKLFERALEYIAQRHEALRTIFIEVDGEPRQAVQPNSLAALFYKDVRNMEAAQQHRYIRETIALSESKPFDLAQGPLMRTMLFQQGEELYHFYLNLHHIITDGWSNELLAREISVIYEALEAGRTPELADVEIQYVDYAEWQEQEVQNGRWQQDEAYWLETLAKPLPTLELPTDSERPEIQTDRGDVVYLTLPPELARGLRAQASEQEVSMFMLLLAGYVLFLHQHTRQEDIIVGTPMAGRLHQTLEPIIGFFVNTLAIRTRLEGVESVQDLVRRVKEQCLSAFEHQAYPFDLLIEKVNPERDLSRTPIFSTMFTYRQIAGMESSLYEPILPEEHEVSKFDLNVIVNEVQEALSVRFEYNTDLFRRETVEQFAARWELALHALTGDASAGLRDLNLLTEQDRAVYASLNDTAVEYGEDRLLHEAFVEQAAAHPERVAVSCLGETMTYGELHERSNRLAHALREQGAAPNQLVAVLMERSLETLVALYGILKAGAAYVPIDPEYPEWRIRYMLANSEARVLITKGRYLADVSTIREELPLLETVLLVDDGDAGMAEAAVPAAVRVLPWSSIQEQSAATPEPVNEASDLAYAIYTSGSTGQPKGTLVSHRAIGNLLNWLQAEFPLQEQDCVGQRTSICFDASVWELFWPLAQGARMVIIPTEIVLETARLHALMAEERVSVLQFVPSLFNSFLYGLQNWKREQLPLPNLRYLFLGGEALPAKTVNQWYDLFGTGVKIVNQYGPTEAAVDVACCVIDGPQTSIPIGRPVANTQLYVLDANGAPCPVNVPGELYIGGVQLAEGYHNNPAKTAEAFLPNHLSKQPGQRLYRTGDLAKVRPDGNLEYCGRLDNQVKVRGYRIELGEIEEVLGQHPAVDLAAVLAMRGADGTNSLLGFYTTRRADLEAAELKQYLSGRLPDYMVPPRLFALDVMPLSPNGKIDRKALEALSAKRPQEAAKQAALPTNAMQEEILAIWQEVLQHDAFGIDDNFFDVGGHSIALAKVHSALREKLSVQVPLTDLFKYPTIQTLAEALTASLGKSGAKTQQAKKPAVKQEADAVAIIGMSMRFPDASSPHEFWENLRNGVESVREFPLEELELTPFTQDPELRDQLIRVSALLDDIDKFDAGFFGIPEKEAMLMNPQHRLFLECAWEAIEDGGYNVEEIQGPVSVYGGCGGYEYLPRHGVPNLTRSELFQAILASQSRFLTSRVSYKLNLTGESLYVDTACSTSLVAIHMACQSLLNHQSDYALAGGASIQMPQKTGYIYEPGFVNSEDGHCRAFDKDASGTANGSGVGIVFLKRLSDALEDGDPIYAVIKGSAINNDGNMKIGYTAPSETGQMEVIAKAQAAAGVTPDDITYIEAHGTGTILGDPIEVRALTEVFREQTDRRQYCALGSVKTNVGHLDSAAGVAGLIKTVLALKHRELPPSLNFQAPNPALNLEQSPFYVNVAHQPWVTENNALRRAGVSSFGIGGTNAHVILEEAPSDEATRY